MSNLLSLWKEHPVFLRETIFLSLISLAFAAGFFFFLFRRKMKLAQIYFLSMMILGSLYSFVLMPLSAPDEVLHFVSAYALSSEMLGQGGKLYDKDGNLRIRKEDEEIDDWTGDGKPEEATVFGMHINRKQVEERQKASFFAKEKGYGFTLQKPVKTTPLAYFFPALGFSFARILYGSRFTLLYFGRFFNLLFFSILGSLAIEKIPMGKEILFSISLFPMTLELISSLSYDAYILALSFLLLSMVFQYQFREEKLGLKEILWICLIAIALSPCKMVYSLLFLLCVMVSFKRFSSPWLYFIGIFAIGLSIVLPLLLVNLDAFSRYVRPQEDTVNLSNIVGQDGGMETYNRREILAQPDVYLKILRNTFFIKGKEYWYTLIGRPLGQFDNRLSFPLPLVVLFSICPFLAGIFGEREEMQGKKLHILQRIILFLIPLGLIVLILSSMLFAYTPKRTDYVLGVQGRYFLPVLPLFILCFMPSKRVGKQGKRIVSFVLFFQILANLSFLLYTYISLFLH